MKKVIVLYAVYDDKSGHFAVRAYDESKKELAERDIDMLVSINADKSYFLETVDFIE